MKTMKEIEILARKAQEAHKNDSCNGWSAYAGVMEGHLAISLDITDHLKKFVKEMEANTESLLMTKNNGNERKK